MTSSNPRAFDVRLLLACVIAWLLAAGLSIFAHGPMPLYSTRTLSVAWEMWLAGEWIVPQMNGAAYSHKAPLLYWLYHAGWLATGVSDVWPRVLALAFGALVLVGTARLGRRLFPQRLAVGELAPWLLAGALFFLLFAMQLMFDMLLTLCVLGAFLALLRGDIYRGQPHWPGFALAIALGLLAKGPVMLLHVAFPLLLAPWWSASAREQPWRWYRNAALALLAALALFAAWLVPAALRGGEEYRSALLWTQTAGRLVESFDHARAWWWYLAILPALLLPWSLWPAAWRGLPRLKGEESAGVRFLVIWLAPTFIAFSLVSGKQPYYLLPEVAGVALLLAAALDRLAPDGTAKRIATWPLALALLALGIFIWLAPLLIARYGWRSHWPAALANGAGTLWGLGIAAAGAALLPSAQSARTAVVRAASASLFAIACLHAQFTVTYWSDYDLEPVSRHIATVQQAGRPVAHIGIYHGQFQFLGRLQAPLAVVHEHEAAAWARAHPNGVLVRASVVETAPKGEQPLLRRRFRTRWLELWEAPAFLRSFAPAGADGTLAREAPARESGPS